MARSRKAATGIFLLPLALALVSCADVKESAQQSQSAVSAKDADSELASIAREALGDREGAILVIDPRNGRVRVAINPRLSFEQAFPPGSAIKPFTALAALRSGIVSRSTRHLCRGGYRGHDYEIICSHPQSKVPLDLPHALAYSCNDYFATVSERLSESSFQAALKVFGFGSRTGINGASEVTGSLLAVDWQPKVALGESDALLVTPIQLITGYASLLNGGRLYRPRIAPEANFRPELRATLNIAEAHRAVILDGMRGTAVFGTAKEAGLASLPAPVYSKTGTSTTSSGFRTQGWFVAFAGEPDFTVGVLVFLKRAHGAEGAQIARPILEAAMREPPANPQARKKEEFVKVHRVTENETLELSLEDYITGVVAAEGSTENELEALKALAVVSRTYALRNRGRHIGEGYDFCSTTHCQRYLAGSPRDLVFRAVRATAGEVLRDSGGSPIDAYFHAACGGATADVADLWGVTEAGYLHTVRDDYCASSPDSRWLDRMSSNDLLRALRKDPRTDVGRRLNDIIVTRRDVSGRAEWMALEGEQRRIVRGWDFKIIVGRTLGWNVLKSSRFEVVRNGSAYSFKGSGFGHGLGLCQAGAHVAARRGTAYQQILRHYFKGLSSVSDAGFSQGESPTASYAHLQASGSRTLKAEGIILRVPPVLAERDVRTIMATLEAMRADLRRRLERAGLPLVERRPIEVVVHATTASFIEETGQPGWAAAATRGSTIVLQPAAQLRRRGVLESTLRHEYAHAILEGLGDGKMERWMAEGLAIHLAGEGRHYAGVARETMSDEELDRRLAHPPSREEMMKLYAESYHRVREMLSRDGEAALLRRIVGSARRVTSATSWSAAACRRFIV